MLFFFSSRRRHTRYIGDWSSDVCSSDLPSEASDGERGAAPLFEASLNPDQKTVFEALRADESLFVDAIFSNVQLSQPRVVQALLELEMSGLVRQLPGKNFMRKR